jgi:ribosomal protein L19
MLNLIPKGSIGGFACRLRVNPAGSCASVSRVRHTSLSNLAGAEEFFKEGQNNKPKNYAKHGAHLMHVLEREQIEKREAKFLERCGVPWESISTGDVVSVTYYESLTLNTVSTFKGIVIGKFNHGVMKSVALRNTIEGVEAEMRIPLLSPLVKDVEIVRKRAKRTRAKLYYLRDRSVQENTFD